MKNKLLLSVIASQSFVMLGLIYFLWGIGYNKKPFEWKRRPVLGLLVNICVGINLLLIGWVLIIILLKVQMQLF